MTLYKALFLFQHNVQNQAEVTKQRKPRNRTDNNQSRKSCRYVFGTCGNGCIRRRFHTGVFLTDPPVAVFADEGGQTVLTVCTSNTVFAVDTILTVSAGIPFVALFAFLAGCLYAEGSPALTAVIGDIPNVIVVDF